MGALPDNLKSGPEHALHFYSLPLASTDTKLFVFESVLKDSIVQELKPFAQKIQSKVPQDDLRTLGVIHSALADADHLYGDPVHAIGKSDAIYIRVSKISLEEKFGEETARRMGQTWMREMHGHRVAIGEPLMDSNGEEEKLDFRHAKKACLDLNPPETREEVTKAFYAREAALYEIREKNRSQLSQRDGSELLSKETEIELAKVHKEHPLSGCYLMSREEWMILEEDFGRRKSKFIPQILPKLRNRWFWSSSLRPGSPSYAFHFHGRFGFVKFASWIMVGSVRCGCALAE